jgi:hypothetical protein
VHVTRPDLPRALEVTSRRGDAHSQFGHLLDVQFWLMGRDVEHPGGNVLARLGFRREASPEPGGRSRYCASEPGTQVVIWPCGMFLGTEHHGCLMVRGHQPTTVDGSTVAGLSDAAQVLELGREGAPAEPGLLAHAAHWFAGYERRVEDLGGIAHRVPKPGTAPTLAPPEPWSLAGAWLELSESFTGAVRG